MKLESGSIVRRHVDSVRKRYASGDEETLTDVRDTDPLFLPKSQDSLANSSSPAVDSSTMETPPPTSQTSEPSPLPLPPSTVAVETSQLLPPRRSF